MNLSAVCRCSAVLVASILAATVFTGCSQAHAPNEGSTRTEDVSQVVYNEAWLKHYVILRNLVVDRLDENLLQVTAQIHSKEAHTSRIVYIRTEFYSPELEAGGIVVGSTDWQRFTLEPRKRVQYQVNSMVPADDFRIYVYYGSDLGKS